MYCPSCNHLNVPGAEACENCKNDLTAFDRPTPIDKIEASLMGEPVAGLGPKPPVTILETATLGEAVRLMLDRGVGAVLIISSSNELVGILTERDFLTKVAGDPHFGERLVKDFMTTNPETVGPTDPLAFALGKMDTGGYRHLPVVGAGGRPVGVVSVRDVLRHVTRLCKTP